MSETSGATARPWKVGDVVQIDPAHDEAFGGCYMTITEPKSWGAVGFVAIPERPGPPARAYYHCPTEAMHKVGDAEWMPADETDLPFVVGAGVAEPQADGTP